MIPLNTPYLNGNEKKYLNEVIDSGWLSRGKFNERFEEAFAKFCGVKYALSVTSGTVAVQVLLMAAGLQGKKVAVPAYTCMSVAQAVVHAGCIPVFVDVEMFTYGMDIDSLKRMYKKEKFEAVLLNHIYGFIASDTEQIKEWCSKNKVMLLEDASEAHGAESPFGRAGSIGEAAAFSCRSEKMIGVGEGGIVVTNNKDIYDRAYYWINDARPSNKIRYWVTGEGWNFFMPNLLGAMGLAQVEQLDKIIKLKRNVAKMYQKKFYERSSLLPMTDGYTENKSVYWLNVAIFRGSLVREDLITMLAEKGIESRPGFYPLNKLPPYKKHPTDETPNAWKIGNKAIAFPSNVYMTQEDINYIFKVFDEITK